MNENEVVSPVENALDSLKRLEKEIAERKSGTALDVKGILAWAWHAVILLAHARLSSQRESFDAWMQEYLQSGDSSLVIERDVHRDSSRRLGLVELIDMLSDVDLPILKPEFYQGWQDRTSRCHELRRRVRAIIGKSVGSAQREELLLLAAVHNRLLLVPVETEFSPERARKGYPALLDVIRLLVDDEMSGAESMHRVLDSCTAMLDSR